MSELRNRVVQVRPFGEPDELEVVQLRLFPMSAQDGAYW